MYLRPLEGFIYESSTNSIHPTENPSKIKHLCSAILRSSEDLPTVGWKPGHVDMFAMTFKAPQANSTCGVETPHRTIITSSEDLSAIPWKGHAMHGQTMLCKVLQKGTRLDIKKPCEGAAVNTWESSRQNTAWYTALAWPVSFCWHSLEATSKMQEVKCHLQKLWPPSVHQMRSWLGRHVRCVPWRPSNTLHSDYTNAACHRAMRLAPDHPSVRSKRYVGPAHDPRTSEGHRHRSSRDSQCRQLMLSTPVQQDRSWQKPLAHCVRAPSHKSLSSSRTTWHSDRWSWSIPELHRYKRKAQDLHDLPMWGHTCRTAHPTPWHDSHEILSGPEYLRSMQRCAAQYQDKAPGVFSWLAPDAVSTTLPPVWIKPPGATRPVPTAMTLPFAPRSVQWQIPYCTPEMVWSLEPKWLRLYTYKSTGVVTDSVGSGSFASQ